MDFVTSEAEVFPIIFRGRNFLGLPEDRNAFSYLPYPLVFIRKVNPLKQRVHFAFTLRSRIEYPTISVQKITQSGSGTR